jgi:hypothetical protein
MTRIVAKDFKMINGTKRADMNTSALVLMLYRMIIKSFPDYKYLFQENYVEYKYIFYLF